MKIFTISEGRVSAGARVEDVQIAGGTVSIKAIVVGEKGRGRSQGLIPVEGHLEGQDTISEGKLGTTRRGGPKLLVGSDDDPRALLVLRTPIGFRGDNYHSGDLLGQKCIDAADCGWHGQPDDLEWSACPACRRTVKWSFAGWPCTDLVQGKIAQGCAGYAGSGDQKISTVAPGSIFRTGYSGRLYGKPASHYYYYDGETIRAATWKEREHLDW